MGDSVAQSKSTSAVPQSLVLRRHTKPILASTDCARRRDNFLPDKLGMNWNDLYRQLFLFDKRYISNYIEDESWIDEMNVHKYQKIILFVYNLAKMEGATLNTDGK